MSIAEMIALVAVVTEFIKKALATVKVNLEGKAAMFVSWGVAAGVVLFDVIQNGKVFNLALVAVLLQVIIGSNIGYKLLKGK
jgi:hypothetical protein